MDKCICGVAIKNYNDSSKHVFLYFTEADGKKIPGDRLYRYQWINGSLLSPKLLIDIPVTPTHPERHAGGAILIDIHNDTLYLTTGDDDGLHATLAQNEKKWNIR